MNRRDALKLLAGLPLLGFLKPEPKRRESLVGADIPNYEGCYDLQSGDEPITRGIHTSNYGSLYISPNGTLYVNGAFVNPPISNEEYRARWNEASARWSAIGPDGVIFAKGIRATTEPDENIILRFNAD